MEGSSWEDNCDGEEPVPGSSSDLSSELRGPARGELCEIGGVGKGVGVGVVCGGGNG